MCGICGYISKKNISESTFEKMVDALTHRGPDDRGTWVTRRNDFEIGMGHRRLSILDCSSNGHQPMFDETGRYCIVFNGEIYNYREIKKYLKEFRFSSNSDTEVLLYSYIKYGEKCLQFINGMYSFAIYDLQLNKMIMARDKLGKKPSYYFWDGEQLVFASELKSIEKYPHFEKKINKNVLVQYFSQNAILPPYTIYENVFKLHAGEYLIWENGSIRTDIYYSPIESFRVNKDKVIRDYSICKKTLKQLLYESVERRLIADVPVGTFLSGGIDSTLVTAIANDIKSTSKIDAFTIGFNDEKFDESCFAEKTAEYLGVKHHKQIMSEDDLLSVLDNMVYYYDEPFSDSSQLATMLVSRFAREHVTVSLSGDGGDELFAGYSNIDTISQLKKYERVLDLCRLFTPKYLTEKVNSDSFKILFEKKRGQEKIQYYSKMREGMAKRILINGVGCGTIINPAIDNEDWQQQRMLLDLTNYLPDENLCKTDRASMRYSLEMRCPILDYKVVDFSMSIPFDYKYNNKEKKYILKDILYDYVPKDMMDRPKQGFGVPLYRWLNTVLQPELLSFLDKEFIEKQAIFDYEGLMFLYKQFLAKNQKSVTQIMWSFLVFQKWYRRVFGEDYENEVI